MDFRDSKFRLILIVVALGIALIVVVASCGGDDDGDTGGAGEGVASGQESEKGDEGEQGDAKGGDGEDGKDEEEPDDAQEVLAQVTGGDELTLTIVRADREEGGFLTVEGTLHNGGGSGWGDSAWAGSESELAVNGFSMAGATLTAKAEGKKYLILRDTAGRCLCTRFDLQIGAGETVNWFAQFPAPEPATTQVDFHIGQLPPATFEIR